jgi:hypothetical protein
VRQLYPLIKRLVKNEKTVSKPARDNFESSVKQTLPEEECFNKKTSEALQENAQQITARSPKSSGNGDSDASISFAQLRAMAQNMSSPQRKINTFSALLLHRKPVNGLSLTLPITLDEAELHAPLNEAVMAQPPLSEPSYDKQPAVVLQVPATNAIECNGKAKLSDLEILQAKARAFEASGKPLVVEKSHLYQ